MIVYWMNGCVYVLFLISIACIVYTYKLHSYWANLNLLQSIYSINRIIVSYLYAFGEYILFMHYLQRVNLFGDIYSSHYIPMYCGINIF